jgi:hypothetical protein
MKVDVGFLKVFPAVRMLVWLVDDLTERLHHAEKELEELRKPVAPALQHKVLDHTISSVESESDHDMPDDLKRKPGETWWQWTERIASEQKHNTRHTSAALLMDEIRMKTIRDDNERANNEWENEARNGPRVSEKKIQELADKIGHRE